MSKNIAGDKRSGEVNTALVTAAFRAITPNAPIISLVFLTHHLAQLYFFLVPIYVVLGKMLEQILMPSCVFVMQMCLVVPLCTTTARATQTRSMAPKVIPAPLLLAVL